MDFTQLNTDLLELIEKRNMLVQMDYNDDNYDDVEDALHDKEDDFVEEHGEVLEDVLGDVHEELNIDTDVLLPTAYIPKKFIEHVEDDSFEIDANDGVLIESDEIPNKNTRLVLVPNPARILFIVDGQLNKIAWSSENSLA